jgi:predicted MFS family arabinose efflux permease
MGASLMGASRRYEIRLVVILFFAWGTVFLDRMSQMYLAPYFAPEFHLSDQQIGTLASMLAITWAMSTFVCGALSDRFGRKPVLLPAVFAFSLLSWLSAVVHSYEQLLLVRALMGLAEGPTWSIMTALIEESSPPNRRGRNIGIVVSAAALVGLAGAPVLTTQIAARWGWRSAFFLAGVPGLIVGFLIWKFVKEPPSETREGAEHHKASLGEYLAILQYRNVWLCCIGAVGFMTWLFVLNVFAPLYITRVAHESATTAGFFLGASGLGSFFLGFMLPALSDRIGRKPVLLVCGLLAAVVPLAYVVPSLYAYPWLLAGIVFLANTGQGIGSLTLVLVPTESVPAQFRATSIGVVTMVGEIFGATASPLLAGTAAEKHGLEITMWMAAAGSALVFIVALLLRETAQRKAQLSAAQQVAGAPGRP